MRKYIDLHSHTTASDGTLTPTQLVQEADRRKLAAIAITDHNTILGVSEALLAGTDLPIEVIPGIEMDCGYGSGEIHILGYLLQGDYSTTHLEAIQKDLQVFIDMRHERNNEIIRRLNEAGIEISMEDLYQKNPNAVVTRGHIARTLVSKGYFHTASDAFSSYLGDGSPFLPPKQVTMERVMDFFHKYHFFISLAHPTRYHLSDIELENLVKVISNYGAHGIECYHSSFQISDTQKLLKLAHCYKLLPTGGSDFHGENKPKIQLGVGYTNMHIPYTLLVDMKKVQC